MPSSFYWFGVKKLEVAPMPTAPATTPTWTHVPSIESAALRASASDVKVYGDDVLQYTFVHSPEMQINVKLTKFSATAVALITGNTVQTVSTVESMLGMTNKDLNPPLMIARVTLPAKDDATGTARDLKFVFFKVQARPVWDGMGGERSKPTELNWVFDVLASTKDEKGDAIVVSGIDYAHFRYDFPTT